jgi:hypothetical protein
MFKTILECIDVGLTRSEELVLLEQRTVVPLGLVISSSLETIRNISLDVHAHRLDKLGLVDGLLSGGSRLLERARCADEQDGVGSLLNQALGLLPQIDVV